MRIKVFWAWFDLWIGVYISEGHRLYICLVPTIVIQIYYGDLNLRLKQILRQLNMKRETK